MSITPETGTKNLFTHYGSWYKPSENLLLPVSACGQHNPVMQAYLNSIGDPQQNIDPRSWALRNGWLRFGTEAGDGACTIQGSYQTLKGCWNTLFPRIMRGKFDTVHIETVGPSAKNAFYYLPTDVSDLRSLNVNKSYNYDTNVMGSVGSRKQYPFHSIYS